MTDILALADEWCERTEPDDMARLNVRAFAVWANLRSGVRVTGDAGLREALRRVYDDGLMDAPVDDDHRWCDEDSGGNHRLDSDLWLNDLDDALRAALSPEEK